MPPIDRHPRESWDPGPHLAAVHETGAPAFAGVTETGAGFDSPPPPAPSRRPSRCPTYPLGVARGQVAATYIVAEAEDGLVIVDQHAAHERLVLERMRAASRTAGRSRARRC